MKIFPAIDIVGGCAVRLCQGDYNQMTTYSNNPLEIAQGFKSKGAEYLHVVDLEGAKSGVAENLETIKTLIAESGLKLQVGGGIRNKEMVKQYIEAGVMRVILGTAALTNFDFLKEMVQTYGDKIAVGVDIKGETVAIKGWTELSQTNCYDFCRRLEEAGVKTVICTDIAKDGMLAGTNTGLYKKLSEEFAMDIVASGGVSSMDDVRALNGMGVYGAILGKALYTGNIDIEEAILACKE